MEIERLLFKNYEYIVSFYPNQPVLIKTNTGVFICATEDLFKGYYTFGLDSNVPNCNRGALIKNDKDLYFVNTQGDVCHYELEAIWDSLKTKQETWGLKNFVKPSKVLRLDAKDICEGPGDKIYSLTSSGHVKEISEGNEFTVQHNLQESHIFFTAVAATEDYVCVSGYMTTNQHNVL